MVSIVCCHSQIRLYFVRCDLYSCAHVMIETCLSYMFTTWYRLLINILNMILKLLSYQMICMYHRYYTVLIYHLYHRKCLSKSFDPPCYMYNYKQLRYSWNNICTAVFVFDDICNCYRGGQCHQGKHH